MMMTSLMAMMVAGCRRVMVYGEVRWKFLQEF